MVEWSGVKEYFSLRKEAAPWSGDTTADTSQGDIQTVHSQDDMSFE